MALRAFERDLIVRARKRPTSFERSSTFISGEPALCYTERYAIQKWGSADRTGLRMQYSYTSSRTFANISASTTEFVSTGFRFLNVPCSFTQHAFCIRPPSKRSRTVLSVPVSRRFLCVHKCRPFFPQLSNRTHAFSFRQKPRLRTRNMPLLKVPFPWWVQKTVPHLRLRGLTARFSSTGHRHTLSDYHWLLLPDDMER